MGTQSITPTPRRLPIPLGIALALLLVLYAQAQTQTQIQTQTPATSVPLLLPSAIAYDAHGNLYIAEAAGHDIRKVDAAGNITTVAGTGAQGFSGDGGPATSAELDSPQGVAIDSSGNIYIADTHNHRIRKISTATGIIATIAGTGIAGYSGDNASAASAQLDLPTAIALDASGNLYIADTANHRIRKIDATTGIITTVAGNGTEGYSGDNGPATAASLDSPTGLAIDASGNIYIADTHNHRIRKITAATGIISTVAGTGTPGYSGDNAAAATAKLALPHGLAIDAAGNLYIADTRNQRVRKIAAATGQITTIAGQGIQTFSGDNAAAATASLDTPRAITASPTGLITLADTANQRIRRLDSANPAIIHTVAGLGSGQAARLATISIATSAAVAATGQPVTLTATVASTAGKPTGTITLLDGPIALDTIQVPATGQVAFTTAALTAGSHTFTAVYSGDTNFTAATSVPATIGIGVPAVSDFALSAGAATSRTIAPGNSASFTFTVQWQGTPLSSPITLSATGLPPLAKASFNPAYLPPGASTDTFTLTVTTAGTTASRRVASPFAFALLLLPIGLTLRRARKPPMIFIALIITATTGCGDRINTAGLDTNRATPYTITVTGTATTPTGTIVAHTATVTLIIQKPN